MSSDGKKNEGIDGHLFRLIATFEAAAMQQMGKIANPITGDVEVSLEGASDAIEMLDMLRRKTDGNLNEDERRFLDHALYQLRMNYVDVAGEADSRTDAATGSDNGDGEDAPASDGGGDERDDGDGDGSGDGGRSESSDVEEAEKDEGKRKDGGA